MIGILATCGCGREFLRGIYPQQECELCDIKTFNEIWCGGLNDDCDSPREPETVDEDNRFFGTHIRGVIKTLKEFKKSGK